MALNHTCRLRYGLGVLDCWTALTEMERIIDITERHSQGAEEATMAYVSGVYSPACGNGNDWTIASLCAPRRE